MSKIQFELTREQVNEALATNLGREIDDQEWEKLKPALAQLIRGYLFMRLIHSGFTFKEYMTKLLKQEAEIFEWHFGFSFHDLAKELGE